MSKKFLLLTVLLFIFMTFASVSLAELMSKGINTGDFKDFHHINFINSKTGWGVKTGRFLEQEIGVRSVIMRTDDGGDAWKVQQKFILPTIISGSVFIDPMTGWMVGWQYKDTPGGALIQNSLIIYTKNGGDTWEIQPTKSAVKLFNVYFTDVNTGWVSGERGIILHTMDGGKTWSLQKSGTKLSLNGVYFVDNRVGWIVGRGYTNKNDFETEGGILHTEDGGEHWYTQWRKEDVWLNGIVFLSSKRGLVTGDNGLLLYTENGGKTWLREKIAEENLGEPFLIDDNRGWVWLYDNEVIKNILLITEDGGKTWIRKKSGPDKYPWKPFDLMK